MKVLLYFEGEKILEKSGIGRALEHQKKALSEVGIDYSTDLNCEDYDILHINTYGINSFNAVHKAKKAGKKVIYHGHSTEEDFRNSFVGSNAVSPIVRRYLTSLYKTADYIITPTPYSKKLLEGYGIDVPIKAISNGINLEKFEPDAKKEAEFRDYFKLDPEQKVVICVGLFFARKGIIDFVEIARALPDYLFIWFGDVPMISIPKDIRQIVKEDHPDNVLFPGYIKGDVIEGAYSGADLFFFPSYEETEGIVVLEALASKQNVLVRDIPVYNGWLEDKVNCYMGHDNQEFIELIKKITTGAVPSLKEAGYAVAKEKSISHIGVELKEVYEHVLNTDE